MTADSDPFASVFGDERGTGCLTNPRWTLPKWSPWWHRLDASIPNVSVLKQARLLAMLDTCAERGLTSGVAV